jgi:hypothetical protein
MGDNNNGGWMSYLRLTTPAMVLILGFYINSVRSDIQRVSDNNVCQIQELKVSVEAMRGEIVHHLTNSELHVPRSTVVSLDEFRLYQSVRDKQMADLKDGIYNLKSDFKDSISEIKVMLQKHMDSGK